MSNIRTIYLPYAGEPEELLRRALDSLVDSPIPVVVIDNSHEQVLVGVDFAVRVPPAPLTLWQTLWMLVREREPFIWTQSDAQVAPDVPERVLGVAERLDAENVAWGVIFTLSDTFGAVNAPLLDSRNILPDLNFPHYYGDPDWYRRMRLAGLETYQADNTGVTHPPTGGGFWMQSPIRDLARQCTDSGRYYREKWGGDVGRETYSEPWNGRG